MLSDAAVAGTVQGVISEVDPSCSLVDEELAERLAGVVRSLSPAAVLFRKTTSGNITKMGCAARFGTPFFGHFWGASRPPGRPF